MVNPIYVKKAAVTNDDNCGGYPELVLLYTCPCLMKCIDIKFM